VIGDLFQNYAAKYVGISRGIPLSNTNQLWGLAWGALVFGELAGGRAGTLILILSGSGAMILGAIAIALAVAPSGEQAARSQAIGRECQRYGLDQDQVHATLSGEYRSTVARQGRTQDLLVTLAAVGIFIWLGASARRPAIAMNVPAMTILSIATLAVLVAAGYILWKRTRFS